MENLKNPEDMSIDELKIYLELKKTNLKLETLKFEKKINYYKLGYKLVKEFGLVEKLKVFINFIQKKEENKS